MSRISLLSSAFKESPLTCGAFTLRPLTAGSIMILMETGNPLFTDSATKASETDAMQGLLEFLYIHTAPQEEVVQKSDNPAELRLAARSFALNISFEDLGSFTDQFSKIRGKLQAAMVDPVLEKGAAAKKQRKAKPSRTGSPASSSPSAVPEIPSGSDTSSGSSPSPAPSNTITPPFATTAGPPSGASSIWEKPHPQQPEIPDNVIPLD